MSKLDYYKKQEITYIQQYLVVALHAHDYPKYFILVSLRNDQTQLTYGAKSIRQIAVSYSSTL